jgi:trk system potassium uptake protein TrkA
MTIKGDASSIAVLNKCEVHKVKLFMALTTSEKTNLLVCILAKKMGAKKTIARISNTEYLNPDQKLSFKEVGIDQLFCPQQLAALEIERLLGQASFTDIFEFEQGKISVVGFTVDNSSPLCGLSIRRLLEMASHVHFRPIAILRKYKTIVPNKDEVVKPSDHLYLAVTNEDIDKLNSFVGKTLKKIKHIMILGSTSLAEKTAILLEKKYAVSLVAKKRETCKELIERLHSTTVIKGDPNNIKLLKSEGIEQMDAFIALTTNSETNIISSLMAEELGVYKTIASVDNVAYTHISQNIGVDTLINKKIIAANNIFRFVRKGHVEAISSLHGVNGEIIEFEIHKNNYLTKHPIRELSMPLRSIVAGVIRNDVAIIPEGDFVFELHDKVIVFALHEDISKVEALFK